MKTDARIRQAFLDDHGEPFEITVIEPAEPRALVLFGVGAGGDPQRHLPLLMTLAERGCMIAAPHFERMRSLIPTVDELETRARRHQLAFNEIARDGIPAAGVGHSIGGAMMLMLAGATAWTMPGAPVRVAAEPRLERIGLLAPAAAFFRGPGALEGVRTPIHAWVGGKDSMTPPDQAQFVQNALAGKAKMEVSLVADAGHFSFMNMPPPHAVETLPDRDAFLRQLADEVASFVLA
jgi:predicted dienelactone hydrolase